MKIHKITLSFVLLAGLAAAASAQRSTPTESVKTFFKYHNTHSTAFSRATVDARKGWFSDALYKLFLNELQRERAFLKKNPGSKPYFGEGLPFQPWDETCTVGKRQLHKKLTIKPDAEDTDNATVRAIYAFPSPCTTPDENVYKFEMIKTPRGWVIDNVIYDDNSNLVNDLKRKEY